MKKRFLAALLLILCIPALAVFKEKDLTSTLRVLLGELQSEHARISERNNTSVVRIRTQHQRLVKQVEQSNELSLMLYSQAQSNTFDLTYALNQATEQYEQFNKNRMPYEDIVRNLTGELERYSRLAQTLQNIPPARHNSSSVPQAVTVMDSIDVSIDTLMAMPSFAVADGYVMDDRTSALRDSCLVLADGLVAYYLQTIKEIEKDNQYYEETSLVLKEAYDYAQNRYKMVQKQMFLEGQNSFFRILKNFPRYWRRVVQEWHNRYSLEALSDADKLSASGWKGPIVWGYAFMMLLVLVVVTVLSNIIVRLTIRWIPYFRTSYFQSHRGLIIALAGLAMFIIFLLVNGATQENAFLSLANQLMAEFAALLGAIFLSMLIRMDQEESKASLRAYLPNFALAFLVIFFRIIFLPNNILNVAIPLVTPIFAIWQLVVNISSLRKVPKADATYLWGSFLVMVGAAVLSWSGLVMMGLLVLVWWYFQLTLLHVVTAVFIILDRDYQKHLTSRQMKYRKRHPELPLGSRKGAFIEVSWPHDFVKMVVVPLMSVWSLPISIALTCDVFNLTTAFKSVFFYPVLNVEGVVSLSLFKLALVISLFYIFRYLVYALKAFYRVWKTRSIVSKMSDPSLFKETDINFNLADNIIALSFWGIYVITTFVLLKIPTSALALVSTGLATGIGFALKDVLNNFFYGVQLMGGRVRVGDTIECDGIRGQVESLSYQTTQVASEDGSIIAFSNAALFSKNFKNLTRNHQYEMINFLVGVKYGTDVAFAREVIMDALKPLLVKDKYGRDIVDMKKGIAIRLRNFGDSSIDMQVLLFAAVEVHYSFAAAAKEAIYNAFKAKGIEIPFPQQDVYIKEAPKAE